MLLDSAVFLERTINSKSEYIFRDVPGYTTIYRDVRLTYIIVSYKNMYLFIISIQRSNSQKNTWSTVLLGWISTCYKISVALYHYQGVVCDAPRSCEDVSRQWFSFVCVCCVCGILHTPLVIVNNRKTHTTFLGMIRQDFFFNVHVQFQSIL